MNSLWDDISLVTRVYQSIVYPDVSLCSRRPLKILWPFIEAKATPWCSFRLQDSNLETVETARMIYAWVTGVTSFAHTHTMVDENNGITPCNMRHSSSATADRKSNQANITVGGSSALSWAAVVRSLFVEYFTSQKEGTQIAIKSRLQKF